MDKDSKDKLKDVLSAIDPIEYKWDETNTTVGIVAQEIDCATIDLGGSCDTITLSPIDLGNISITGAVGSSGSYLSSNSIGAATWTIGSTQPAINIANDGNSNYIQTSKSKIDIDELADMMETLKKRLLVLTPNFEMHEKYPMLKELYDEYKAMERLLSGPDTDE